MKTVSNGTNGTYFEGEYVEIANNFIESCSHSTSSLGSVGSAHQNQEAIRSAMHYRGSMREAAIKVVDILDAQSGFSDHRLQQGLSDTAPRCAHNKFPNQNRSHVFGGSDSLLLEILLEHASETVNAQACASSLMERFRSIAGVVSAERHQILDVAPLGEKAFRLFDTVKSVSEKLAQEQVKDKPIISNAQLLVRYLRTVMGHKAVEELRLLFLDKENALISDEVQHVGTIDHTPVYPREVVKRALILDASALIMAHNHPSDNYRPTRGDVEMTTVVKDALERVGVVLHDHFIVCKSGHTSFRQLGIL